MEETEYKFDKIIQHSKDYFKTADQFIKHQPIYYNEKKLWWAWNFKDCCWRLIDETDILNSLNAKVNDILLYRTQDKTEMLTALQMRARLYKPKDAPNTWIQFNKTIYDYKKKISFQATPEYFITNPIPYEITTQTETPVLDKFITEWVGEKYKNTIYEIIAYCCVPNYNINRVFCFNGEGRNGKSTLLKIITNFIGLKNCCSSSMDIITTRPFETAKLYKKLVCEMGEINSGIFKRTELIKKLVGSDTIGFEFKGKDGFDGYNYAKILIATNKLPDTADRTTGFYSKWIIIDFNNQFPENPNFLDQLPEQEYNNLATKCLYILDDLMFKGVFTNEGTAEEKRIRYENKASLFLDFYKEELTKNETAETPFFQLYNEYLYYCEQRGLKIKPSKILVVKLFHALNHETKHIAWTIKINNEIKQTTIKAIVGISFKNPPQTTELQIHETGLNSYTEEIPLNNEIPEQGKEVIKYE